MLVKKYERVSACIMVIYACASLSNHGTGRAQAGAGRRSSASLPPTAGTTRDQLRRVYLLQIGGQPNGINNRHSVRVRIIIEVCVKVSTKGNITLACSRIKKAAACGYVFLSAFLKIFFVAEANAHLVKFMGHEMDGSMVINKHRVSSNVLLHQTGQGMCDGELGGD
ncbi:hypothetical protein BRADI_4g24906v3 [Brachypodium distachyon]|uniref:Uncharacterized protein n=1 Tax=Brachypodium distachyon TaxID=15368 RepID=A0A0Q3ISZ7_BRADI|nr:hypothetical protein BRADI_4g24906v3 [Brachypodium distachyon]